MSKAISFVRSVLFILWMIVTVIPVATAVVIASIFIRGNTLYRMCRFWLALVIHGARALCGVKFKVHGMDRLPDGPAILLPKHQSTWETFAFPVLMPRPLSYVFKRELIFIPFFGWAISRLDMVHIDRSRKAEAWNRVASQGRQFMDQGSWVIMFPEGTRIPRGQAGQYKAGGTRLAVTTGVPVVPIAVTSARCWPRKSFLLRPGTIDISIGAPIPSVGRQPDELMREVQAWIEGEMHRLDPTAYSRNAKDANGSMGGSPNGSARADATGAASEADAS